MADSIKQIWEKAMVGLIINFPTYAELIAKIGCKFVKAGKSDAATLACTDGKKIYLNEELMEEFNLNPQYELKNGTIINRTIRPQEMQFILCHELLHLLGLTFDRSKNVGLYPEDAQSGNEDAKRRWELWNQATDYEINSLLWNNETTDQNYGDKKRNPIGNLPEHALYNSDYIDMPAEEIYRKLVEKEKEENGGCLLKPQSPIGLSSAEGGTSKGEGMHGLDSHLPITDEDTKNEIKERLSELTGSRTNGLGESSLDRMIDRAYKPMPFNWRKALTKYIRGWIKANYTWNKPSRAGIASGLILPSAGTTPQLHIGVAIDTSGSISEIEIQTMMNHMFTILQQFKSFEIDLWCCGSVVYEETLMKLTGANKRDLYKFKVVSDGGNDMRKNFEFIKEYYKGRDKIDLLIIFSDFYDPLDGDTETVSICPCVFLCLDHKDFVKPELIKGEVIHFQVDPNK